MTTAPDNWVDVCHIHDLPELGCLEFTLGEQSAFITHYRHQWHAYINRCPHAKLPLNWMPNQFFNSSKTLLLCSAHGAQFTPDEGRCVTGPCLGKQLHKLTCEVREQRVFVLPLSAD